MILLLEDKENWKGEENLGVSTYRSSIILLIQNHLFSDNFLKMFCVNKVPVPTEVHISKLYIGG